MYETAPALLAVDRVVSFWQHSAHYGKLRVPGEVWQPPMACRHRVCLPWAVHSSRLLPFRRTDLNSRLRIASLVRVGVFAVLEF